MLKHQQLRNKSWPCYLFACCFFVFSCGSNSVTSESDDFEQLNEKLEVLTEELAQLKEGTTGQEINAGQVDEKLKVLIKDLAQLKEGIAGQRISDRQADEKLKVLIEELAQLKESIAKQRSDDDLVSVIDSAGDVGTGTPCPEVPQIPIVNLQGGDVDFQTIIIYKFRDGFHDRQEIADKIKIGVKDVDIFDLMGGTPHLVIRQADAPVWYWIYFDNPKDVAAFWDHDIGKPGGIEKNQSHIWILFNRGLVFDIKPGGIGDGVLRL